MRSLNENIITKKRKEAFLRVVEKYQDKAHKENQSRRDLKPIYSTEEGKILYQTYLCDSFKVERPKEFEKYLKQGNVLFAIYDAMQKVYILYGGTLYQEELNRIKLEADNGNNYARVCMFKIYHYGVKAKDEKYNIEANNELANHYIDLALKEKVYYAQEAMVLAAVYDKDYIKAEQLVKEYRIKETNAGHLLIGYQSMNAKVNPTNMLRAAKYFGKANLTFHNLYRMADCYSRINAEGLEYKIIKDIWEFGGVYEKARYAFLLCTQEGKREEALKFINDLHKEYKDNVDVIFNKAYILAEYKNNKKKREEAIKLYESLLEKHEKIVLNNLTNLYVLDKKVDGKKIISMYERAYELNKDPVVLYNIALDYYYGNIVGKDLSKAFGYFEKAYKEGNLRAAYYLGIYYQEGLLGEKDIEKAIKYYNEVKGDIEALYNKSRLLFATERYAEAEVTFNLIVSKLEKEGKIVEKQFEYIWSNYFLAHIYAYEIKNDIKAELIGTKIVEYLEKNKLTKKYSNAYVRVLNVLNDVRYLKEDFKNAYVSLMIVIKFIKKNKLISTYEKSYMINTFRIGQISVENKKYKDAKKYYSIAAKYGEPSAVHNIGVMYERGYGVRKNIRKAKELYEKAKKMELEQKKK